MVRLKLPGSSVLLPGHKDDSEQTVAGEVGEVGSSRKEEETPVTRVMVSLFQGQVPQTGYDYRFLVRPLECSKKGASRWIECVDFSILDIANQESVTKLAKMVRRLDNSPGVYQRPATGSVSRKVIRRQQITFRI